MNALQPVRALAAMLLLALPASLPSPARAAAPSPGPALTITRTTGTITPDGDLSDPGWQGIPAVTTWFETNVGDNVEPQVKNVAYLAYDEKYFYAAFQFEDPKPDGIRAPIGDHDQVPGSTDYAGVIVDSHNDGKTAAMFLANPNGVQYDALTSDATGEDSAPDFFWDSEGKVTETGWNLEIRIPFSSLRYATEANPTWRILLYRNYPRDRRYQFFTARLPRDVNCFICNSSMLNGLQGLPRGSHLVVAPFATAQRTEAPAGGTGTPLRAVHDGAFEDDYGLDVKWNPSAAVALDGTLNPDFSQVEADAAQIGANERFALFYPEKRAFFLEGSDLFSTPLSAVYTRTITKPDFGGRATGRVGSTAYTVLYAQDKGGGQVILPGTQSSAAANQDFKSDAVVTRVRRDLGRSFVSALVTAREVRGGGHNRVAGPDFQWRPSPSDAITGQLLFSESRTPDRPDLAGEWDGRTLSDRAFLTNWSHNTRKVDWYVQGQDFGSEFRADNGFIPQVGYSSAYGEAGYTIRPEKKFFSRIRFWTSNWYDWQRDRSLLSRRVSAGAGMDGKLNSFIRIELNHDAFLAGTRQLERFRPRFYFEANPGRILNNFGFDLFAGQEVDFANAREGRGASLNAWMTVRPNDHLALNTTMNGRWLYVDDAAGRNRRLFFAQVERVRATYSFSSRSFLRVIGQYEHTNRDPALYLSPPSSKSARMTSTALFAYKLNWQTVFFAGYGDVRTYAAATDELVATGRQIFAKVSYALQP